MPYGSRVIFGSFVVLLAFTFGGCGLVVGELTESTRDESEVEEYWGGYKRNETYVLSHDVFLARVTDWSTRDALVPPDDVGNTARLYSSPSSTEGESDDWPDGYGIVLKGTRIQMKKVLSHGAVGWGRSLHYFAVILDGKYAGMEVDISDLSDYSLHVGSIITLEPSSAALAVSDIADESSSR